MSKNIIFDAEPYQEVNKDTYWYFLEILPPAFYKLGVFQMGEPFDHDGHQGRPRYGTYLHNKKNNKYYYAGILSTYQAMQLAKLNLQGLIYWDQLQINKEA